MHWLKSRLALYLVGICLAVLPSVSWASSALVPLPEQEVRAAVERLLTEKLAGRGWETTIRQLSMPQGVTTSKGVRDLELIPPSSWEGWEPVSLALIVRVNGVVEKNLSIRLLLDARTEMVTAKHQLLAGTVLTADDLELQKQDLSRAGGLPVRNIADVIGKKTRMTIRTGAPIRSNQVVAVPVIVSGQLVTIIAENEDVRITVSGKARSSGGIGDLIRVQNLMSNKEIPARVVDASTVEVGF